MEISFGKLEEIADYETLAKAFFAIATPEQVERVAKSVE
jgi:hypothetical protein